MAAGLVQKGEMRAIILFLYMIFDPGYSAINLVTYVYQNVQKLRTSKGLFKNIFRTKYWCVSVVYVKKRKLI